MEHVTEGCNCKGKLCKKCGEVKCLDGFYHSKALSTGRRTYCIACEKTRVKKWVQNNPERDREKKRRWAQEHPDKIREASRKHHRNHPEKYQQIKKMPQQNRQSVRKWKQNHPEAKIAEKAQYRAHLRNAGGSFTAKEWKRLKARYNYVCLCCGKQEPEIKLTPDHVIPLVKGGTNYIDNIQPLCLSCNSSKREKIIDFRPQNT